MEEMINFTVGPVQCEKNIRDICAEQVPYFRTEEFSNTMFENEALVKKFMGASEGYKTVFITGSGTASMESVVANLLTKEDKAIIVNGGSFGQRFVELCNLYSVDNDEIKLDVGEPLTEEHLKRIKPEEYTAFIVNLHETSTGVLYDIDLISEFCKKNGLFLIVDAISAFLADYVSMSEHNIDAMITGSQKALACQPGISIITMSERAVNRAYENEPKCMYLSLKEALENAKRGQTPFTPAVGILRQINVRLKSIEQNGGVQSEIEKTKARAEYFRNGIADLPFEMITSSPSNAVTSLHPINASAFEIFLKLKDNYNIWICPNGGALKDEVLRVGHIGDLSTDDYDKLINAFKDLMSKGEL